ncbi:hypothetical protein [Campylobacter sp. CCUG 57310]|uniref:hypothetical protein n=1 Tax=Campylobacter sp. CCUG 57310 TaxID=2517362 RepID=UPI0015644A6E|nr:hypothetical protein [Campylobacter sp. CCUG 57310]QKF92136.1 hypothetical protein CORI_0936 [Campylobacter sp. CCUG 57310]
MDIFTMTIVVSLAVAAIIYMQIQKITKNIDQNGTLANNSPENLRQISVQKYKDFCELINSELRELKNMALYDDMLKDVELKDSFLESLSEMSKKLTFIETMNTARNPDKWESELFEVLNRLDELVEANFKDGELVSDEIRDRLSAEFAKLQN